MKKNLILLIALFVMQMVSAQTYPTLNTKNNTSITTNLSEKVNVNCIFDMVYTQTYLNTEFWMVIKKYGVVYSKTSDVLNVAVGSLNLKNSKDSIVLYSNQDLYIVEDGDTINKTTSLKNLTPKTGYRVRPFIIYGVEVKQINPFKTIITIKDTIVYGNEISITTRIASPIVSANITNRTSTSVTISGTITGDSINHGNCTISWQRKELNSTYGGEIKLNVNTTDNTFTNTISLAPNNRYSFTVYVENKSINNIGKSEYIFNYFNTDVLDNKEDNFKVYPNPSKGKFNVDLDNSTPNNKIKIFDTTGRLVYSTEILNTKTEIDLTDKNLKGIYLMKVINVYGICVNESKLVFD